MKEKILAAIKQMKGEQWVICGLAGILLLVISMPVKQSEKKEDTTVTSQPQMQEVAEENRESYEKQLEEVLTQVEGVGKVRVAVTMESTGKKQIEKDHPQDTSASSEKDGDGTERTSQSVSAGETTIYEEKDDGGQTPYISSQTYPEIRGVLVVAEGGNNPVIVQQIREAVMALFHVEAHEIKVLKMK